MGVGRETTALATSRTIRGEAYTMGVGRETTAPYRMRSLFAAAYTMGVGRETTAALATPPSNTPLEPHHCRPPPRVTIPHRAPCRDTEDVLGGRVALLRTRP